MQKIAELNPLIIERAIIAGGVFDVTKQIQYFSMAAITLSYVLPFRWNYWLFSWLIMPKRNHQKARRIFIQQAKKLNSKAYRRWVGLFKEFKQMVDQFKQEELKFPLLAVMGGQDYVFLKAAKTFVQLQEKAQLHIIPKCGHICNIEESEQFNLLALGYYEKSILS